MGGSSVIPGAQYEFLWQLSRSGVAVSCHEVVDFYSQTVPLADSGSNSLRAAYDDLIQKSRIRRDF